MIMVPARLFTPDYIARVVEQFGLGAYYPAIPSSDESGARRGCVVLAKQDVHGPRLEQVRLLRRLDN